MKRGLYEQEFLRVSPENPACIGFLVEPFRIFEPTCFKAIHSLSLSVQLECSVFDP
jgi:hypothetical protein